MQNRAIQNSYSPGSIFKLIMADAGLEEGLLDDDPAVNCRGAASYYGRTFHCARKGRARIACVWNRRSRNRATSSSMNWAEGSGFPKSRSMRRLWDWASETGIDLPGERAGVMPSPEWKMKNRRDKWYAGETISVSIGQGAVSVTPLQMLRAVSAIATGGLLTTPHVLLRAEGVAGAIPEMARAPDSHRRRDMPAGSGRGCGRASTIMERDTTPRFPARISAAKPAPSRSSAMKRKRQSGEDIEDHSWFAGFGNRDNPEIAVVVFLEHGGKGGVAAAPLAKQIFSAYFEKKNRKR